MTKKWQDRFFAMVDLVASWSEDEATKIGCVIVDPTDHRVLAVGYNGMPRGVANLPDRQERPRKYLFFEHAERNAIYNLSSRADGCVAFMHSPPCADCARALIQAGITSIFVRTMKSCPRWAESCQAGVEMLMEAGVLIHSRF